MSSRKRVEAAFSHVEPDRTPIFEYVLLSPVADSILGRKHSADKGNWPVILKELGWERAVKQFATDVVDLAVYLDHDMIYTNSAPINPNQKEEVFEVSDPNDPVEVVRARNEFRQANLYRHDSYFDIARAIKEELDNRGLDIPLFAPAYIHGIWTDIDLMQAMLLSPEVSHKHFELCTKKTLNMIDKYKEIGVFAVGIGGDFAGNTLMISPESYHEFIMPQLRKVSDYAHKLGLRTINTSDGNLWPVLEDFLIGCDVDAYMEIDMHAGMDLAKLKSQYGDRITLMGNLDCGNKLSFGTEIEIEEHVRECLNAGMGNGGHIFCTSNAITASVPLKNYMTVVKTYREFFGLTKLPLY